jgi:hypothetical protein
MAQRKDRFGAQAAKTKPRHCGFVDDVACGHTGRLAVDNASLRSALPTAPAFAHKLHSATYYLK